MTADDTPRLLSNSEYIELMRSGSIISIIDAAYKKGFDAGARQTISEVYDDE